MLGLCPSKRLSGEESGISEGWNVLKHIRRLLQMEWDVKACHIYREANRYVDTLAQIYCELVSSVIFYDSCPTQITHIFLDDKAEISIQANRIVISFRANATVDRLRKWSTVDK
jgi:hypothetical protein